MKLTIKQAIQKGIASHKEGKLQEAEKYYRAVISSQARHPDANHNLGVLAIGAGKVEKALTYFKVAVESNPNQGQLWLSYIEALIKNDRMDHARQVLKQGRALGLKGQKADTLETKLSESGASNSFFTKNNKPSKQQIDTLISLYNRDMLDTARTKAHHLAENFRDNAMIRTILGAIYQKLGRYDEAIFYNKQSIFLNPKYAEAYNNLASVLKDLSKYSEAIKILKKAIKINPLFSDAYYNSANIMTKVANNIKADSFYKMAIIINPSYEDAYWNKYSLSTSIPDAIHILKHCNAVNPQNEATRISLEGLRAICGFSTEYKTLNDTRYLNHPYKRSFNWFFNLPEQPAVYFNRWCFFDKMIALSQKNRPFYEYGVWRAESFRYLLKNFKKGFGFDTFSGLPEKWHDVPAGAYSSYGVVPEVEGGEFFVGKFEDTLPIFFSKRRPKASLINFDADLYRSTICALNYSKDVIDEKTVLIFDEFIINPNWEHDEYRALEDFCAQNEFTYKVLAVSFFTKQVAVRLIL